MLSEICQELRNWFDRKKIFGKFEIQNGQLTESIGLQQGQYFRIIGSVFNDGVHQFGNEEDVLQDEEPFDGAIWLMAIPPEVVDLAGEIDKWCAEYAKADSTNMSPFSSESFGGYSYSKGGTATSGATGGLSASDWRTVFGSRLNKWRKI